MSIGAMNWVNGMHKSRIKPNPRHVLKEMADFADESDECWPSVETLSNRTSLSPRAVQGALRVLEAMGAILTFKRRQTSSRYRLNRALDLSQPLKGADAAPSKARGQKRPETSSKQKVSLEASADHAAKGAASAPTNAMARQAAVGAENVGLRVQETSSEGAAAAPKPPENHQRTIRGRGARARPTPLPPDWQPGEAGEAYARRLGLDPAPLAARFRKTFRANGKRLVDWSQRWELWCDEDAAEKGSSPAAASPAPGVERDARGLTAADRGWLARWQAKLAAGEHTGQLEEHLAKMLSPEGKAELARLKAATSQAAGVRPEIFRSAQPKGEIFFTRP